jgi:DNA-binding IclR family transcriptional regulator
VIDKRRGIQSVEIGYRVLDCLERASRALTMTEIAKATHMSLSKLNFYLISLLRLELIAQGEGGYRLGPATLRLGVTALGQVDVLAIARAQMSELRRRTKHSVYLSVWGTHGPTVVDCLDGEKPAPTAARVGLVVPMLRSSIGNVFLAYLPRPVTETLVQKETRALKREWSAVGTFDRSQVKRIIADVRRHGLARQLMGLIPGFSAIAAPVFDGKGAIQCVLSLVTEERDLDETARSGLPAMLVEAAWAASRAAGLSRDIWRIEAPTAALGTRIAKPKSLPGRKQARVRSLSS